LQNLYSDSLPKIALDVLQLSNLVACWSAELDNEKNIRVQP
jgi:hypothetical protein